MFKALMYVVFVLNPIFSFASKEGSDQNLGFQLAAISLFTLLLILAIYYRIWKVRKKKFSDVNTRINSLPITKNGRAHINSLNIGNRRRPSV